MKYQWINLFLPHMNPSLSRQDSFRLRDMEILCSSCLRMNLMFPLYMAIMNSYPKGNKVLILTEIPNQDCLTVDHFLLRCIRNCVWF